MGWKRWVGGFVLTASAATASAQSVYPAIASSSALLVDAKTGQVLYAKNSEQVHTIASLTKLMTALVWLDNAIPWNTQVAIHEQDVDIIKNSKSRLRVGSTWTVEQLFAAMLIGSDNRAAHALARTSPGGTEVFIQKMNTKAKAMGLTHTTFVDASGLNPQNMSTPRDIALLTAYAAQSEPIRTYSTQTQYALSTRLSFRNTNRLVRDRLWSQLWISKTGFTNEAGRCVAMMGMWGTQPILLVLLDSHSTKARENDANTLQRWFAGLQSKVMIQ